MSEAPAGEELDEDVVGHEEPADGDEPGDEVAPLGWTVRGTPRINLRRTYDWPAIRILYVEGEPHPKGGPWLWPSLSAVAERFEVVAQRVRERSREEGWVDQRARHQAHMESVRQVERAKRLAEDASKLEVDVIRAARMGISLATARLQEIAKVQSARTAVGDTDVAGRISAKELDALARTVDQFHRVGLRALGQAETTTRVEQTGPAGGPIDLSLELRRDDPRRLADVLALVANLNLGDVIEGSLADGEAEAPALGDSG